MPKIIGGLVIDTAVLDRITKEIRPHAARIIETHGTNMAGMAAQNAPVDTSALRNSVLSESGMVGELTYAIQDGVEYGIFQELGTSKMAAQPFVIPAIESGAQKFLNAFAELFK
jgi:HK97 gp10 family phage protein